ncbi:MAG TPA: polysaccharide pyruvyl transferase family protein [Candidatus Saccharimonadales bacterium]
MTKKILLINSDLAKNRGDRAIAEGVIELARHRFPEAQITGISQFPERDKQWYGIDFLNMDFQSLNPFQLLRLYRAARKHDIILWGGGEILKDYTNKAALWYWTIKMSLISLANRNLYGTYQGIGPTHSSFSKRLIVLVVKRCKAFIVRDEESYEKLVTWGAPKEKLFASSDPAVLPKPNSPDKELSKKLSDLGIDESFLKDFICIGPRDWFHYKQSGILPFKYKRKLYNLLGIKVNTSSPEHDLYLRQLSTAISSLTAQHNIHVLLIPMHMEEGDTNLCTLLQKNTANPAKVKILSDDTFSSKELRSIITRAKAMIGFRLHSNIIGVSAGIPSINIYYVDKGRVFFDQIGQSRFALPIQAVLEPDFPETLTSLFNTLLTQQQTVKKDIRTATGKLRKSVTDTFSEVVS